MLKFRNGWSVALMLVVALTAPTLHAEDNTTTIRAGETQALVSGAEMITITMAPARGTATVKEEAGPPKKYTLLYTGPETRSVFTETFKYTDPTERSFTVTVTPSDEQIYSEAFKVLFVTFVVALLLESGLAVLFNWRPWVVYFDGRGVKAVVSVVIAFICVRTYQIDLITRLVNVYSQRNPPFDDSFVGYLVTALVIAGGSAAVNNLLVALGFRTVRTVDQVIRKPEKTEAWISVLLIRKAAVGPVDVLIGDPTTGPPVAGTIVGGQPRSKFVRLFVRDASRFPMSGGFAVPAGTTCAVKLQGRDANSQPISSNTWGPNKIAAGAIIDLELEL